MGSDGQVTREYEARVLASRVLEHTREIHRVTTQQLGLRIWDDPGLPQSGYKKPLNLKPVKA